MSLIDTFVASNQNQGNPTLLGASEGDNPLTVGGITSIIQNLAGTANQVYNAVTKTNPPPTQVANQSPVTTRAVAAQASSYMPWILGGLAVLAVIFFFSRK